MLQRMLNIKNSVKQMFINTIKNATRLLLIFTFATALLPTMVIAESDTSFNNIFINKDVSFIYKVLNSTEDYNDSLDSELSNLKISVLDASGNVLDEIDLSEASYDEELKRYTINGEFAKNYDESEEKVKYLVEYSFNVDVNGTQKTINYSKEYTYEEENDGISIDLVSDEIVKIFAPSIVINKKLDVGTPNGIFTFKVKSMDESFIKMVTVETSGGNKTEGGSGSIIIEGLDINSNYIIEEVNHITDLDGLDVTSTYELVSITSDHTNEEISTDTNSIAVKSTDIDDIINVTFTNKSKVDHSKNITDNKDGTHKISLDVTGENEKGTVNKANIVIVMDASNSMNTEISDRFVYTYDISTYEDYIYHSKRTGGDRLYYRNGRWRTADVEHGSHYNGNTVYASQTRMTEERKALYSMVQQLLANNTEEVPDVIDISLVSYNLRPTNELYNSHNYTEIYNAIRGVIQSSGTNWEEGLDNALIYASRLKDDYPDEEVYVIFLTDGEPTARKDSQNYTTPDPRNNYEEDAYWKHWNGASDEAKTIAENYHLYTVFTYGTNTTYINYLNNLTRYAYGDGTYDNTTFGNTYDTSKFFFNATNTSELVKAFNNIANDINLSGIGSITISDGTTQSVTTSAGVSNLLSVDESSYEYWLTFNVTDNNKIRFNDVEVTITSITNGYRLSYTENNVIKYVDISSDSHFSEDGKTFVYKWTGKNALYNVAPPAANLVNGSVNWVLSKENVGLLLNDVKYSVTFDVWPSQYTYDLISELDNGIRTYDSLEDEIKKYLIYKEGNYTLRTNTKAILKYDDSRDGIGERLTEFVNPEPISTGVQEIYIKKKFENKLDSLKETQIDIYLTQDKEKYGKIGPNKEVLPYTLTEEGKWSKLVYISTGLISFDEVTKTAIIREVGHDYSFVEKPGDSYHWDLVVDILHPMMINNELTMLVKTDKIDVSAFDSKNYIEENGNRYFKICNEHGNTCAVYMVDESENANYITATNKRRSNLNLIKVADKYDDTTTFTFEITIDDSNNNELWFSIYDTVNGITVMDAVVAATGIQKEYKDGSFTGYYHFPDENTLTVTLKPYWNLRFTNLPNDSKYTIKELAKHGYTLVDAVSAEDETLVLNDATVTGKISKSNVSYTVTFTNKKILTDVEVKKEWLEDNLSDRPESITVRLFADNSLYKTVVLNDDNSWYYKWTDLNIYSINNIPIVYSVDEDDVKNYYKKIIQNSDYSFTIQNTNKNVTVPIEIVKEWIDYNPNPSDNIGITIYGKVDGNESAVSTVSKTIYENMCSANGRIWTCRLDLPKYYFDDNDSEHTTLKVITYSAIENFINGLQLDSNYDYYVKDSIFTNQLVGIWHSESNGLYIKNTYKSMPTVNFIFKKVAYNSNNTLDPNNTRSGAIFRLYRYLGDDESDDSLVDINANNSGKWALVLELGRDVSRSEFNFNNLYKGEYRLIEIEAPNGCVLPDGQWKIFVDPDKDAEEQVRVVGIGYVPGLAEYQNNEYLIPNKEVPNLPSTGGIGIVNYNLFGFLFMILGLNVYIMNRINLFEKRQ